MIFKLTTGAAAGIFTGYLAGSCRGTAALLALCFTIAAGFLAGLKLRKIQFAVPVAAGILIALRCALFLCDYPYADVIVSGLIAGIALNFVFDFKSSIAAFAGSGMAVYILTTLFVSGSGEECIAFICGALSILLHELRNDKHRKAAVALLFITLYSLFPAGQMSKVERMRSIDKVLKLEGGASGALALTGGKVATSVLLAGKDTGYLAKRLEKFPGMQKVKVIDSYAGLYPLMPSSPVPDTCEAVMCTGSGRMCRLASRYVAPGGVLVIPEKCVTEIPSQFRHWSELPNASGFIVLSRDFVIDCSGEAIERKMQQHLKANSLADSVPKGVFDALFSASETPSSGIREIGGARRINYTLWFFGLVSGLYLMLRLIVFSRFDRGERRWSAFENTASVMLLFLLLKRSPGSMMTSLLPTALFFALPIFKLTGGKHRLMQICGAALCGVSLFRNQFIHAAQLVCAVCCGSTWCRLRSEKGAVVSWVDSCSFCGLAMGAAIFSLLLTLNAPPEFITGIALLLRSNSLFRSL